MKLGTKMMVIAIILFVFGSLASAGVILDTPLSTPGCYTGSGCDNNHFAVDNEGNLQLGLGPLVRFVGAINPIGTNLYDAAPGADPSHPTWATWGYNWSVNTQNGGGTNVLGDYLYTIQITNLTTGTPGSIFDPLRLTPDNSYYGSGGKVTNSGQLATNTELTTDWSGQNTLNNGFGGVLPGFDPNASALYQIVFSAYNIGPNSTLGSLAASVTTDVQVGSATPEPTTFVLMGAGLGVLGMLRRRTVKK
jgi:hypothetical protein